MATVSKREWTYKGATKTAWIVRYLDPNGVHRQKTFALKKAADAYRRTVEDELDDGTHIAFTDGRTVRSVCDEYLKHTEARIRDGQVQPTRYKQVRMALVHAVIPYLGGRTFHEVTAIELEDWYRKLRTAPSVGQSFQPASRRKPLSARTAKHRLSEFSTLFKWAIRRGYAKTNPCHAASEAIGRIKYVPIKTFMPEQVAALLQVADERARGQHRRTWLLMRCVVNIAAFCGLRYGEIMALTLEHVNVAEGWIAVRHSLTDGDLLKDPKTAAGVRDVPIPQHLAEMLKQWISYEYRANPRGLLFRGSERTTGGDIASRIFSASFRNNYWWPLLKRAGLFVTDGDQFHFHALRHFSASWMVDNGLPITDVANVLGHAKFDMTLQVYAHPTVNGARRSKVFDRMATRLLDGQEIIVPSRVIAQDLRMAP